MLEAPSSRRTICPDKMESVHSFSYSTVRAKDMIGKHGMDAMELAFPDGWPKGIGCYDAFRMASGNLADNEEEEVAN